MNLIRTTQLEKQLQICSNTLRKWEADGLPIYRLGRVKLVKLDELEEFVTDHGKREIPENILKMMGM